MKKIVLILALLFPLASCKEGLLNAPPIVNIPNVEIYYVKATNDQSSSDHYTFSIRKINSDGTNDRLIVDKAFITSPPRNGRLIYILSNREDDEKTTVWISNDDGSNPKFLAKGYYHSAELSPDGTKAYLTTFNNSPLPSKTVVVNTDGSGTEKTVAINLEQETVSSLSPDGKNIVFLQDVGSNRSKFVIINSDGSNLPIYFSGSINNIRVTKFSWSATGDEILFSGDGKLYLATISSTTITDITPANINCGAAVFSPYSKKILFSGSPTSQPKSKDLYETSGTGNMSIGNITNTNAFDEEYGEYLSDMAILYTKTTSKPGNSRDRLMSSTLNILDRTNGTTTDTFIAGSVYSFFFIRK